MSAHTPGPWQAHPAAQHYGLSIQITGPHGHPLASCGVHNGMSRACENAPSLLEAESNARLIAAAPELLAALHDVLDAFQACIGLEAFAEFEASNDAVIRAESAIAKAE